MDSSDLTTSKSFVATGGITQQGPLGGNFSISVDGDKYDTNSRFSTINPRYDGQLSFTLTQPLLKNFGWQTARREILVARNSRDIAENTLKSTLLDTVYAVEQAYWELRLPDRIAQGPAPVARSGPRPCSTRAARRSPSARWPPRRS